MTVQKINVTGCPDSEMNGNYIYDEVTNHYIRTLPENIFAHLYYIAGRLVFYYSSYEKYYNDVLNFETMFGTNEFLQNSAPKVNITITNAEAKKRSRRGNKTKWV